MMTLPQRIIRTTERIGSQRARRRADEQDGVEWPPRTTVIYEGDAIVVRGLADLTTDDLELIRGQHPGRHVTLDGDCVIVWPSSNDDGKTK